MQMDKADEEEGPLPVGRAAPDVERLTGATKAVELLASLVVGDVADSLRDEVRKAVQPVESGPRGLL